MNPFTIDVASAPVGITIVITCKGRLTQLRHSVPRLLRQQSSRPFEIIVVDYGDPDDSFDWVIQQDHPQLAAIRVLDNTDEFNLSRARNCGASVASCPLLSFVDADALLAETWLETIAAPIASGTAVAAVPAYETPACGLCTVTRSLFHNVRGFDESFRGWGHEDIDFLERISHFGNVLRYDRSLVELMPHAPDLRVSFYSNKNFSVTRLENADRAAQRHGPVNPDGYGIGTFKHFPVRLTAPSPITI